MQGGSRRGSLACALLKQEITARAETPKNALERMSCARDYGSSWFPLRMLQNCFKKAGRINVEGTLFVIRPALRKGAANVVHKQY